jgi:pSer/pThr/pTyr-binding forkhead associated (FHA) protein
MPKLTLQCDDRVLNTCAVGQTATIGRLGDNTVVIDNTAVSGRHARVFRNGDSFVVEDLASTNGTFVNDRRIHRHVLKSGDVVRIGGHTLLFDESGGDPQAQPEPVDEMTSHPGDTMYLDANKHKALLAWLKENESSMSASDTEVSVAVLRVIKGRADQSQYTLDAHTSLVGKSDAALVRLKGWFKPKEALAIARNGQGYVATAIGGTTQLNKQRLRGRQHLADGDVLEVGGLTLEFKMAG